MKKILITSLCLIGLLGSASAQFQSEYDALNVANTVINGIVCYMSMYQYNK